MPTQKGTAFQPASMADLRGLSQSESPLTEMIQTLMDRIDNLGSRLEDRMKSMEDRMEETDRSVRGIVGRVTMLERAPLEEPHGQVADLREPRR